MINGMIEYSESDAKTFTTFETNPLFSPRHKNNNLAPHIIITEVTKSILDNLLFTNSFIGYFRK